MSRPTDSGREGPTGARHDHANHADSAGQPWAGRSFPSTPPSTDDGSAPERLIEAIRRFQAREVGEAEVVDAFRESRLLIPLVAHLGEAGENHHGELVDKSQELSIVTVDGPDGRTVLPVFSSVDAMSSWNAKARPIPADGVRVALAAASEQTDVVVLDPTSPTEFAIRRPALWAIAQSQPWTPSYADRAVIDAFERSIGSELAVVGVELSAGDPGARLAASELVIGLRLLAGLTQTELDAVLARLAQRWAADEVIATRVDSLAVKLSAA